MAPHDRKLRAANTDRLAEIEAFFHGSIKAAQAEGAVPGGRVSKDLARLLLGVLPFGFSPARTPNGPCSKALPPALALLD